MQGMDRILHILNHPLYKEQYAHLQEAEKDRVFCRHTMEHFLDVARIMYIFYLERQNAAGTDAGAEKEIIYAAALLHDIGRCEQITAGTPHHTAGAYLAGVILPKCGFTEEETARIQRAIENHRQEDTPGGDTLSRWLYRADKLSRNCFCCAAAPLCNWPDTKKNHGISC